MKKAVFTHEKLRTSFLLLRDQSKKCAGAKHQNESQQQWDHHFHIGGSVSIVVVKRFNQSVVVSVLGLGVFRLGDVVAPGGKVDLLVSVLALQLAGTAVHLEQY